jgi:nucleoside-diphosphate-sugar epimerase
VARCLIIGCSCRGLSLAVQLRARGHAVRGTTRDPDRVAWIEAAGAEAYVGDPDRIATLAPALEHVAVVYLLLGSAVGDPAQLEALHSTRLEMLLTRMLDTTVRGVIYEGAGSVDGRLLAAGCRRVRTVCERALIPYVLLRADPRERRHWLAAASAAVEQVLR